MVLYKGKHEHKKATYRGIYIYIYIYIYSHTDIYLPKMSMWKPIFNEAHFDRMYKT